jgi:hypothetical protein
MAATALPVALAQGDAALAATLHFVRSEALLLLGREDDAEAARLDGLAWAGYGLGEDGARSRLGEVRSLIKSSEES